VSFTDAKGFIGIHIITATAPLTPVITLWESAAPRSVVSAHAKASRDAPAYFTVQTGSGPVMLYTSPSLDWVIEYVDENGVLHVENNQDAQNPEKAATVGSGKTIFVKIYPYNYSEQGEVYLYAENANAISVSPMVPAPFAAPVPQPSGGIPAVSLTPFCGLAAAVIALLMRR
jgi:hypothetical protein